MFGSERDLRPDSSWANSSLSHADLTLVLVPELSACFPSFSSSCWRAISSAALLASCAIFCCCSAVAASTVELLRLFSFSALARCTFAFGCGALARRGPMGGRALVLALLSCQQRAEQGDRKTKNNNFRLKLSNLYQFSPISTAVRMRSI